ncbi:MAG: hypothetical protein USCGTAYLOR_01822 [Chromatiales bacterium USCg_Taylor]|nr:MAG: hypothetical protein USCGTAYLOR_01822 [Chromatiales bacterium USCg_Taylor]
MSRQRGLIEQELEFRFAEIAAGRALQAGKRGMRHAIARVDLKYPSVIALGLLGLAMTRGDRGHSQQRIALFGVAAQHGPIEAFGAAVVSALVGAIGAGDIGIDQITAAALGDLDRTRFGNHSRHTGREACAWWSLSRFRLLRRRRYGMRQWFR